MGPQSRKRHDLLPRCAARDFLAQRLDPRQRGAVGLVEAVEARGALAGGGTRPDELLTDALVRARTMELVADDLPGLSADHAFTVGLFSMLPSLVNRPMEQVVGGLGLPADIQNALLDGRPPYGALLDRLVCHLGGDFMRSDGPANFNRLDDAYRAALAWVEPLRKEVERGAAA